MSDHHPDASPIRFGGSRKLKLVLVAALYAGMFGESCLAQAVDPALSIDIPGDRDARDLTDSAIMDADRDVLVLQGSPPEVARAVTQMDAGQLTEAEASLRGIIEREARKKRPDVMMLAGMESNLGIVLHRQHRIEEAEDIYRRALDRVKGYSDRNETVYGLCTNFANLLDEQGKYQEAEALYHRTIAAAEKEGAGGLEDSLGAQINLARVLYEQGKSSELAVLVDKLQDRITRFNFTGSEIDRYLQQLKAVIAAGRRINRSSKGIATG